jgi:hypothetical protein
LPFFRACATGRRGSNAGLQPAGSCRHALLGFFDDHSAADPLIETICGRSRRPIFSLTRVAPVSAVAWRAKFLHRQGVDGEIRDQRRIGPPVVVAGRDQSPDELPDGSPCYC